jgi:hypothetical protein
MESAIHHTELTPTVRMKRLGALAIVAALAILFVLLPGTEKPLAQLLLVPVLFAFLWRLSICGVRIPRALFVVAAIGIGVGALIRFSYANLARGAVLVATVSQEDLPQERRIYRDKLRRVLGGSFDALIGIYHQRVANAHDALEAMERFPKIGGVIWGTPQQMTMSLRYKQPLLLTDLPTASAGHQLVVSGALPPLQIIRSIPHVTLGQGHREVSVFFLSKLILLWKEFSTDSIPPEVSAEFDRRLRTLFRVPTQGGSRVHLAVPMWMLGTYHLVKAVRDSQPDPKGLTEAIVAFKYALSELRGGGNPGLELAVRNNYAIALLVEFTQDPKRNKLRKAASKQLGAAVRLVAEGGMNGAVAADNYTKLQAAGIILKTAVKADGNRADAQKHKGF